MVKIEMKMTAGQTPVLDDIHNLLDDAQTERSMSMKNFGAEPLVKAGNTRSKRIEEMKDRHEMKRQETKTAFKRMITTQQDKSPTRSNKPPQTKAKELIKKFMGPRTIVIDEDIYKRIKKKPRTLMTEPELRCEQEQLKEELKRANKYLNRFLSR